MSKLHVSLIALALASSLAAQSSLTISIAVRETETGGDVFNGVGSTGTTGGGIEWVNLDVPTIPVDGSWTNLSFNLTSDPITAFAGTSANSILEGTFGVLEHVRILNSGGIQDPLEITIDNITNTWTDQNGQQQSVNFGDFEGFLDLDEVVFQEPSFSGSTAGNILTQPFSTSGVDNYVASIGSSGCAVNFQFVDNTPTRWVRLTTFSTGQPGGNPQIRFDGGSVISFDIRAGRKQETLGTSAVGNVIAEMFGTGLNASQSSTFYLSRAVPQVPGAFFVSLAGGNDLPFLGGTLYSFTNFLASVPVGVDANGMLMLPTAGSAVLADFVFQGLTLNPNAPGGVGVSFSNAVIARYGI